MFNIPKQITQGDEIPWVEELAEYDPSIDTLSCFIRGESQTNLTATDNGGKFEFLLNSTVTNNLRSGRYKAQFVIFPGAGGRKTLGVAEFELCPSFENITDPLETRTTYEIELEQVKAAISSGLKDGVAEYYIGDRRVRYHSLAELFERQRYLQRRINLAKNPQLRRGRNVPIRFCD